MISVLNGISVLRRKGASYLPYNLILVVDSDSMNLTWSGGKLASIERSTDGTTYTRIGFAVDIYSDIDISPGTLYYYRVKGTGYSNVVYDTSYGTLYYVKTGGNDANTGLSDAQAWLTINKVNTSSFNKGDRVLFNKGNTWRETLTVPSSGDATGYITFGTYGTGDNPKILGSDLISGWNDGYDEVLPDLANETFNAAGYDLGAAWSEAVGAGSVVDEDSTDITDSAGGNSQILKIQKVSPNYNARTKWHTGASMPPVSYCQCYINITAEGLSDGNIMGLLSCYEVGGADIWAIRLLKSGATLKFSLKIYNNGALTYTALAPDISLNTWYKVEVKWDLTNSLYECRIDGDIEKTGSLTGTLYGNPDYFYCGDISTSKTITVYYDNFKISSTGYPAPAITYAENVWASNETNLANPTASLYNVKDIYFLETNGDISWGRVQKTDIADLAVEYDWGWYNYQIWIYSPTDPNTRYSDVELGKRTSSIALNDKEYISIDGLELSYGRYGIYDNDTPLVTLQGLMVKNCLIHHIGVKEMGYGISANHSNTLFKSNVIHDTGRRGISIYIVNSINPITVENILIEDNTIYKGHHVTGIDIANQDAGGGMNNIVIRRNFIYDDPDEVIDGVENFGSTGISIQANSGGTPVTNVEIYYNIVKNVKLSGLFLVDTTAKVYNNTFYGVNPTITTAFDLSFIRLYGLANVTIKNNIFYVNLDAGIATSYYAILALAGIGTIVSDYNLFYNPEGATAPLVYFKDTAYTFADAATYKAAKGQDAHSIFLSDPLLTSASDFHLQAGSPAINAGVDVGLTEDYEGNPIVGIPDIGGYEY